MPVNGQSHQQIFGHASDVHTADLPQTPIRAPDALIHLPALFQFRCLITINVTAKRALTSASIILLSL